VLILPGQAAYCTQYMEISRLISLNMESKHLSIGMASHTTESDFTCPHDKRDFSHKNRKQNLKPLITHHLLLITVFKAKQ
jgi:hypothetical protein